VPPLSPSPLWERAGVRGSFGGRVIKVACTNFSKLLKVFGKGFKGKTLFQKGFPLKLLLAAYTTFEPL
jgi:hypothetical protein